MTCFALGSSLVSRKKDEEIVQELRRSQKRRSTSKIN
jgi:hypothetical protein